MHRNGSCSPFGCIEIYGFPLGTGANVAGRLEQLALAGADFISADFLELVDAKLAELSQPPFRQQAPPFGLTPDRRRALETSRRRDLAAVVRIGEPAFDIEAVLARFNALWGVQVGHREA